MDSPLNTADADLDLTGRLIGDYTLFRRLGRGGMADVYLARQESLQRNVALKILKPELARDHSYVKRFQQEAQSAANLTQSNIVQIYEVGHLENLHFIAQEYVHGRNLRQYLDRHGAVDAVMAVNVLRQCAFALKKAAEFDVIHRDIKPENIMISTTGEVKVTDFGLARVNNDSKRQALTQIGITMGTPLYMSPEQVAGGQLDCRSDIYSLGITAYHMLAGQPPFEGENALAIAFKQVQGTAVPITELRPDLPVELGQVIQRMMAKELQDRPQNPGELLNELRKIKIDLDEGWEQLLENLQAHESHFSSHPSTVSQSRLAATQQLQAVLKGHRRSWWKSPRTLFATGLLSIAALITGTVVAKRSIPQFPLDVELSAINEIPRKESVEKQYEAAYWGTYALAQGNDPRKVEYWQAVLEYFPVDQASPENRNKTQLYQRRAQTRLGEVYLSQRNLRAALKIYETLEGYDELSEYFRVTGSAGKAIVYDLMSADEFPGGEEERRQKVRQCLGKIGSQSGLLNQFMRESIASIRERYSAGMQPLSLAEES